MNRPWFLVGLLLLAGCGGEPDGRVLVLGIDGLDPATVDLLMSEGKMPNLARMRQQGAYGRLESQEPLLSPIVWTTIATGKTPDVHGIGHFVAMSGESGERLPVTSDLRRVKALWNIASEAEREVVPVGWWATWPPEPIRGAVVSDHTAYHFLFEDGFGSGGGGDGASRTHPPGLMDEIEPLLVRPDELDAEALAPYVDVEPEALDRPFDFGDELWHFRWALATASSYREIGLELWRRRRPDLELVYVEGVDSTSHLFGHLFRAEGLAGELATQQSQYGRAVEGMYLLADQIVGRYLEALDDRSTLLVLSDHGFELGVQHDDPSRTRDLRRVSERFHRLHGVLYLYGRAVRRGARIDRPTILDVTPTVLALLGLAPARDMPGRVLTEAVSVPVPERIPTWEGGPGVPAGGSSATSEVTQAQLEHLRSLGYLGDSEEGGPPDRRRSPQGDRNLAAILFEQGRFEEAATAYAALVVEDPADAALLTSLAGCLGQLERFDEALAALDRAIDLDPLNVEAYHNRAVIAERRGDPAAATEDYRRALRYAPTYEPSRRALERLVGSPEAHPVRTESERRALVLLQEAEGAAKRGDYSTATRRLDEAEAIAPDFVLVHQYRSNIAYLRGDRAGAAAALERALALEPDNALYRENLKRLGAEQEAAGRGEDVGGSGTPPPG